MKILRYLSFIVTCLLFSNAHALPILAESGLNIDGVYTDDVTSGIAGVDASGFDAVTGLGTVSVSIDGAGSHFVNLFVDHGINPLTNTIFNEWGDAIGTPDAGQSWGIDDPFADIFFDVVDNTLQNFSFLDSEFFAFDASMALGVAFDLVAGETAVVDFLISTVAPTSGFYLFQSDSANEIFDPFVQQFVPVTGTDETIYLSSTLTIEQEMMPVPEPAAGILFLLGLAALGMRRSLN